MANNDEFTVYLKDVRIVYPHLFKKHAATAESDPKYSAGFLFDPSTDEGKKNIKKITAAIKAAEQKEFNRTGVFKALSAQRRAFRKGSECLTQDGEVREGYDGMMFVTASSKNRPTVLDRAKKPVAEEDNLIYSGCRVEAYVRFYGTKKGGGPGIFASLEAVRFIADDEPLGGASPIGADAFDDLDEDDTGMLGADDDDDSGLLGGDDDDDEIPF